MIGALFEFNGEIIEVRINGLSIYFRNTSTNGMFAPLESLQLSREGTIKEWPDLKDNSEWRTVAIQRFKDKMKQINDEDKQMNFIIEDLKKFGYIPRIKQRAGFRAEKIK